MILLKRLSIVVILLTLQACNNSSRPKIELVPAIPPKLGHWCVQPNDREYAALDAAVRAIELRNLDREGGWMFIGAMRTFGYGLQRQDGGSIRKICVPEDILERLEKALNTGIGLGEGRPVEYQLRVAAKLRKPSQTIIKQVANVAFYESSQPSDFGSKDIRPIALTVLAEFRERAMAYRDIAIENMNSQTPLGTGAAQVAVATGAPDALAQVVKLFKTELDSVPLSKPIPYETGNRLLELAWAIYLAGPSGKSHTQVIHSLMKRKIESPAPPFGMLSGDPYKLCYVLEMIEGENSLQEYDYCTAEKDPFRLPSSLNARRLSGW